MQIVMFNENYAHLLPELTELLQQAYRNLVDAGMTATVQQNSETTLARLNSGKSFLGLVDSKLVGTITVVMTGIHDQISWFSKPTVAYFTQFAIHVEEQGNGYGHDLLSFVEAWVKGEGALELALDTSEKAEELIKWYKKRGYRFVEHALLPSVSYRSVVLSKKL